MTPGTRLNKRLRNDSITTVELPSSTLEPNAISPPPRSGMNTPRYVELRKDEDNPSFGFNIKGGYGAGKLKKIQTLQKDEQHAFPFKSN